MAKFSMSSIYASTSASGTCQAISCAVKASACIVIVLNVCAQRMVCAVQTIGDAPASVADSDNDTAGEEIDEEHSVSAPSDVTSSARDAIAPPAEGDWQSPACMQPT